MNFYDLNDERYNERPILRDYRGEKFRKEDFLNLKEKISEIIPKRSVVFLFAENSISAIGAFIAFLSLGIVPVMVSENLDNSLRDNLISIYRPQFLVASKKYAEKFLNYKKAIEVDDLTIIKTENEPYEINEDLALLLTTSGSTGSPKLVRQSYKNINSNAESIVKYLELDEFERPVTMLPFHYTYGISVIQSHLLAGATIFVCDFTVMDREFWSFIKTEKISSLVGVPYTYEMFDKLGVFKRNIEDVKTFTQAGGKLSLELHKKVAEYCQEFNKRFFVMYGQTEATARMSYLPYTMAIEKIGSMGIAIPGGRFELFDGEEIIKEPEKVGELVYYGDNVTQGYAENKEDLNKPDERSGRLETGDMAKRDEEGFYYIVGRKKRFLKLFGNRVNLDELDRLLNSRFKEIEFASTGIDDNLSIFYVGEFDEKEALRYIEDTFKIPKQGFKLIEIEEIPKNEAGKVLYKNLGAE